MASLLPRPPFSKYTLVSLTTACSPCNAFLLVLRCDAVPHARLYITMYAVHCTYIVTSTHAHLLYQYLFLCQWMFFHIRTRLSTSMHDTKFTVSLRQHGTNYLCYRFLFHPPDPLMATTITVSLLKLSPLWQLFSTGPD